MKSALRGKSTSVVKVSSLGPDGFWLLLDERDLFVPFKDFPWFQDARIREIMWWSDRAPTISAGPTSTSI